MLELRLEKLNVKGFSTENLYYHSCSWLSVDNFGAGRLVREVTNSYIGGKFMHCGSKFSSQAPELSQAEIDSVPGAAASLGSWDGLKFEVLERAGESMQIKQDEHKYWVCQTGAIADQYTILREGHGESGQPKLQFHPTGCRGWPGVFDAGCVILKACPGLPRSSVFKVNVELGLSEPDLVLGLLKSQVQS